jgi:GT2 family glycosyltransferase
MSGIRISVVIVNWHSEELLAPVLAALNEQMYSPVEVVIVDNGSTNAIPVELYVKGKISVIDMRENLGFAAANNCAVEQLGSCDWIALLNPDAIPDKNWLKRLAEAIHQYPDVSAFGSKQLMEEDPTCLDGLGDAYHVSGAAWRVGHGAPASRSRCDTHEVFSPCAAAAIYKRSAFMDAGGFDEDFFCYFEDVDLGFRMRLLGHKLMIVPAAVVYHEGGGASGGYRSNFSVYHGQRNLVWTYFKNMPSPFLYVYLLGHIVLNIAAIFFYIFRGQGKVVLRAKRDALRGLPKMMAKRKAIQSQAIVPSAQVIAYMANNWLSPYRRSARSKI